LIASSENSLKFNLEGFVLEGMENLEEEKSIEENNGVFL
jgi:hypothetical protein